MVNAYLIPGLKTSNTFIIVEILIGELRTEYYRRQIETKKLL